LLEFFLVGMSASLGRSGNFNNTMGDINNNHGDVAAGATSSVVMCILTLSRFALDLAPYSDIPDVFSLMCMVIMLVHI
jgi:hypothetical protein